MFRHLFFFFQILRTLGVSLIKKRIRNIVLPWRFSCGQAYIRFWNNLVRYRASRPFSELTTESRISRVRIRFQWRTEKMRYNKRKDEGVERGSVGYSKRDGGRAYRSSIEIVTLKSLLVPCRGQDDDLETAWQRLWSVPPHCKCVSFSYRLAASLAAIIVTWEYQILFVIVARDVSCGETSAVLVFVDRWFDYSTYFIVQCFWKKKLFFNNFSFISLLDINIIYFLFSNVIWTRSEQLYMSFN